MKTIFPNRSKKKRIFWQPKKLRKIKLWIFDVCSPSLTICYSKHTEKNIFGFFFYYCTSHPQLKKKGLVDNLGVSSSCSEANNSYTSLLMVPLSKFMRKNKKNKNDLGAKWCRRGVRNEPSII